VPPQPVALSVAPPTAETGLKVRLVRFHIHCESETFQFLSINNSRSNQNHFVNLFVLFVETFHIRGNKNKTNQNHLKHLFYHFRVTVQNLETFQTNSPLKRFDFSPFRTPPSDSCMNIKRLTNKAFNVNAC
jgi:hypothetical protein